MTVDEWPAVERVLWQARESAFPSGEFVGQESFVSATEILWLAEQAGVGVGMSVLDLCCGVAGPGLFLTRTLGCEYLGVDADAVAIHRARGRAVSAGLEARFEVGTVPPVPSGTYDVVLLLETLLAFRDKTTLLREVSAALPVGGRFAFTAEEGRPLDPAERAMMPGADTVWLTPLSDLQTVLERAGFRVSGLRERTRAHRVVVDALLDSYVAAALELRGLARAAVVDELISGHRLWSQWLRQDRVRKFAVVAEKVRA